VAPAIGAPFFVQAYAKGPTPLAVVQKVCVSPVHTTAAGGGVLDVVAVMLIDSQQVVSEKPSVIATRRTNRPAVGPVTTHTLAWFVGPQKDGVAVPVPGQPSVVVRWSDQE
jgi:hypothetical protein